LLKKVVKARDALRQAGCFGNAQGMALLAEHTCAGRRGGLGWGFTGWLLTMLAVAGPTRVA